MACISGHWSYCQQLLEPKYKYIRLGDENSHETKKAQGCSQKLQERKGGGYFHEEEWDKKQIEWLDENEEEIGLTTEEHEQRTTLKTLIADIISHEETFWWQRSWDRWIKDRNRNTKFFHITASNKKKKKWDLFDLPEWATRFRSEGNPRCLLCSLHWSIRNYELSAMWSGLENPLP